MKYGIKTLLMLALGFGVIYGLNAACIVTQSGTFTWWVTP